MDRIARLCEEVHAFAGTAERTGVTIELRGLRNGQRTCTSLTDLVRKYKLYGDGIFYLPAGQWPEGATEIALDNVKWLGVAEAFDARLRTERSRSRRKEDEDEG
jgi:hypothetical protein